MIPFLRKLFLDETAFLRLGRAAIMIGGGLAQTGQLPGVPPWVGALLMGAAVFLGAGDKNPSPSETR
jgi:uncharacterized membrane protein YkvI